MSDIAKIVKHLNQHHPGGDWSGLEKLLILIESFKCHAREEMREACLQKVEAWLMSNEPKSELINAIRDLDLAQDRPQGSIEGRKGPKSCSETQES